ncbi:iron-sulfur cluster repair di-iron protein, ric [uncultured Helcococcus sp.]|uniref:iron-sulfur cluster repair di-iron protein, ric n=1 Tax=uncultured Helcococcus sp. TaxID=1072508 RepID=UPI00288A6B50|nr:iron-sulfur cluster repair di-iron protein, ric [uncultured Helcococcus sp.]
MYREKNKDLFEKLDFYLPTVKKVHGKDHEEIFEVDKMYNSIKENLDNSNHEKLEDDFINLRKITNDYTIPQDTCETYEAVYKILNKLDEDLTV